MTNRYKITAKFIFETPVPTEAFEAMLKPQIEAMDLSQFDSPKDDIKSKGVEFMSAQLNMLFAVTAEVIVSHDNMASAIQRFHREIKPPASEGSSPVQTIVLNVELLADAS